MAHDHPVTTPSAVPADMLAQHRTTWHAFTRLLLWNALGTAGALVFLLLVAKVF